MLQSSSANVNQCLITNVVSVTDFLDDYTKIKQLGKGAFGVVNLYQSTQDGRLIAVKSIQDQDSTDAELDVLRSLKHKNIIDCMGYVRGNGVVHILLEYMSEGPLSNHCPMVDAQKAWKCIRNVLEGLDFLHGNSVIHRDIKGGNILYNGQVWKISDFGISKIVGMEGNPAVTYAGTPGYMAPEIRKKNNVAYDDKVDIWSLGCTVIEMFDPYSQLFRYPHWLFNPQTVPEKVPEEFQDFLVACFKVNPQERATAAQLLQNYC